MAKKVYFVGWLFLSLALGLVLSSTEASAYAGGDGSSGDPYEISNCTELQDMESNLSSYFELIQDIDCSATSGWNSGAGFDPVGYDFSNRFTGNLDGNSFAVSDLTINRPGENYNGLIGYANTGVSVSNITLTNVSVIGQTFSGAVLGHTDGGLDMSSITVSGTVTCISSWCGGIVGNVQSGGTLSGLHSSVNVTGVGYVGGVFGSLQFANNTRTLSDSTSTGTVIGETVVGGFSGSINWGTISRVSATGNVTGDFDGNEDSERAGGFVGDFCNGIIQYAYATGNVSGDTHVGGFIGYNSSCPITITNSYARGNVTPSGSGTGGAFGSYMDYGTVANSFATGSVAGQTDGGFIYNANACTSCNNNFFNTQTTGQTLAGSDTIAATGKTTAEMKNLATFTDTATVGLTTAYDFEGAPNDDAANNDYWDIDGVSNGGYPFLLWQDLTPLTLSISPINAATNIAVDANLIMNFNTPSGASSGYIRIYNAATDELVESIDVAGGSIIGNGTTTLTINRVTELSPGTTYYVLVDSTAIRANNGIYFAGISSSSTWQFNTVNDLSETSTESSSSTSLADTGQEVGIIYVVSISIFLLGSHRFIKNHL